MNKLELSIVELAKNNYIQAKSYAEIKAYSDADVALTKDMKISPDELNRHDLVNALTRCWAVTELATFDSGLSDEAIKEMQHIYSISAKLKPTDIK